MVGDRKRRHRKWCRETARRRAEAQRKHYYNYKNYGAHQAEAVARRKEPKLVPAVVKKRAEVAVKGGFLDRIFKRRVPT